MPAKATSATLLKLLSGAISIEGGGSTTEAAKRLLAYAKANPDDVAQLTTKKLRALLTTQGVTVKKLGPALGAMKGAAGGTVKGVVRGAMGAATSGAVGAAAGGASSGRLAKFFAPLVKDVKGVGKNATFMKGLKALGPGLSAYVVASLIKGVVEEEGQDKMAALRMDVQVQPQIRQLLEMSRGASPASADPSQLQGQVEATRAAVLQQRMGRLGVTSEESIGSAPSGPQPTF